MTSTTDDDATAIESTLSESTIFDSVIKLCWRCGILFTGLIAVAMGVLYVKVSEAYDKYIHVYISFIYLSLRFVCPYHVISPTL